MKKKVVSVLMVVCLLFSFSAGVAAKSKKQAAEETDNGKPGIISIFCQGKDEPDAY